MSAGGNSAILMCGMRRSPRHVLPLAAQKAAQRCSALYAQPQPYDTHAAGGAP